MVPRMKTMVVAVSLAVALGAIIGSTAALGSAPAGSSGAGSAPNAGQPDGLADQVKPDFQAAGVTSEMDFVPVASCRLVDTRLGGGRLAAADARGFEARGTASLAPQGGSVTGCGLPLNAAAISMSVVAVKPAAGGYLRGWAQGTTEPATSFLNVTRNVTLNGMTIQDLGDPHELLDFRIRNGAGAMHLVVDVTGYYIAPMAALVNADSSLDHGSRVISSAKVDTGTYVVEFDRNVEKCYFVASAFDIERTVVVKPRLNVPNGVYLEFENAASVLTDSKFYLTVTC